MADANDQSAAFNPRLQEMFMHCHFIERCKHGVVVAQCRCPSPNKTITIVPCPPSCAVAGKAAGYQGPDNPLERLARQVPGGRSAEVREGVTWAQQRILLLATRMVEAEDECAKLRERIAEQADRLADVLALLTNPPYLVDAGSGAVVKYAHLSDIEKDERIAELEEELRVANLMTGAFERMKIATERIAELESQVKLNADYAKECAKAEKRVGSLERELRRVNQKLVDKDEESVSCPSVSVHGTECGQHSPQLERMWLCPEHEV